MVYNPLRMLCVLQAIWINLSYNLIWQRSADQCFIARNIRLEPDEVCTGHIIDPGRKMVFKYNGVGIVNIKKTG